MIEKIRITRERASRPLPSPANTASKAEEAASSATPRPLSNMPNARPCSLGGAHSLVALIKAPQKVRVQLTPQKPWMMTDRV